MSQILNFLEDGFLSVSDIHKIHYMTFGNRQGIPLINFHGGPGSGTTVKIAEAIDQNKYYIILFDQRGCGQSVPLGEIQDNNTDVLIQDANKLLKHLGVDRVVVSGGSWGSALAIKYAEMFPNTVLGLFVYAVCLFRPEDVLWYVKNAGMLFPKELDLLYESTKTTDYRCFFQNYESVSNPEKVNIATVFLNYAATIGKGLAEARYIDPTKLTDDDLLSMRIFLYYLSNNYFVKQNDIFKNLKKIKNIPTTIIHGKLDYSCPVNGAYTLANTLSNVDVCILETLGHFNPELREAFFVKLNNFKI